MFVKCVLLLSFLIAGNLPPMAVGQEVEAAKAKKCSTSIVLTWNVQATLPPPGAVTRIELQLRTTNKCQGKVRGQKLFLRWYDMTSGQLIQELHSTTNKQGFCVFEAVVPDLPSKARVRVCGEFLGSPRLKPSKKCATKRMP